MDEYISKVVWRILLTCIMDGIQSAGAIRILRAGVVQTLLDPIGYIGRQI